jgi:thymidylate synthase (FAD)
MVDITQPFIRMMDIETQEDGIKILRKIEYIGRISHRSEEAQTDESWQRFLSSVVMTHGDWSITEHASVTVEAVVDRGVMGEWTRHRIGAYTVESTRFVNYTKKVGTSYICPGGLEDDEDWAFAMGILDATYKKLITKGKSPQIARSVFPFALSTKMVCTYNLRMWRHFFLMRTTKEAHPQMRQVTIPLLAQFQARIPLLYDDIVPLSRQVDNMAKPH